MVNKVKMGQILFGLLPFFSVRIITQLICTYN